MNSSLLSPTEHFVDRHIAASAAERTAMLAALGYPSLDALADATVPASIRLAKPLALGAPLAEHQLLEELRTLANENQVMRSFIGMGYTDCITPPVILRNVLENPSWYTQYTPYQAEIAQGRLEALLNYQTMITELTGLEHSLKNEFIFAERHQRANPRARAEFEKLVAETGVSPKLLAFS